MATAAPRQREVVTMLSDQIHREGLQSPVFTDAGVPVAGLQAPAFTDASLTRRAADNCARAPRTAQATASPPPRVRHQAILHRNARL